MIPTKPLEMTCDRCKVGKYCPRFGSSPLLVDNAISKCRVMGGYGKIPLDPKKASEETKKLMEKHGPCLTIAEVPELDRATKLITYKVVKILSPPILHPREKVAWNVNMLYPQAFDPKKK